MTEEIRDLIEKINQEGVQAAEEKAKAIEFQAQQKASETLNRAKLEADKIIASALERVAREEEKEKILLSQAGRDTLLSLRKEISTMLERIIVGGIRQALTTETLFKLLSELTKAPHTKQSGDITVLLNKEDLENLEKGFLTQLKEEARKGIILKASEEISAGFTISFDQGKSCYDFTDQALAAYIGTYLKPKLNQILKG